MRLIFLLLVVGFAALGCCEEGEKPTIACYKGGFCRSDGSRFSSLKLVSAQSCFTYVSTDCSIVLYDERKTEADFTDLFEHIADYTVVECNSDGCNYNIKSQLKQLKDQNNTLYEQCGDKYTDLWKGQIWIYCYEGKFSDAKGYIKSQDVVINYDLKECYTMFNTDCSIIFGKDEEEEDSTRITCNTDGCNYNMASMMSKLENENPNLYNDCKSTYEKVIKDYKPAPALARNLICANNWSPEKSKNSAWDPLETEELKPFCEIRFSQGDCLKFSSVEYATISTLNTCVKRDADTYNPQRIECFCTSGHFCNTDIEKWAAKARNVEGSDFMNDCDYTGYNYPQPWRFTPTTVATTTEATTTEATTTEATTIESTTIVPTVATTTSKSPQNQPPASKSVPLSTAASFVLLLLVA